MHCGWDTACALPDDLAAWQRSLTAPNAPGEKWVGTFASVTVPKESKLAVRMQALGHNAWGSDSLQSAAPPDGIRYTLGHGSRQILPLKSPASLKSRATSPICIWMEEKQSFCWEISPQTVTWSRWCTPTPSSGAPGWKEKDAKMRAHRASVERFAPARYAVLLFLLDAVAVACRSAYGSVMDDDGGSGLPPRPIIPPM